MDGLRALENMLIACSGEQLGHTLGSFRVVDIMTSLSKKANFDIYKKVDSVMELVDHHCN
jgi:hypothetical protein